MTMLHDFLSENRGELIDRCRAKVAQRTPGAAKRELPNGISPFLEQLVETLRMEQSSEPMRSRKVSGPAGGQTA